MSQTTKLKFSDQDGNVCEVVIKMGRFGFTNVQFNGNGISSTTVFPAIAAKFALSKSIPAIGRDAVLAVIEDMSKGNMPQVFDRLHESIRPADAPWGFRPKDADQ